MREPTTWLNAFLESFKVVREELVFINRSVMGVGEADDVVGF